MHSFILCYDGYRSALRVEIICQHCTEWHLKLLKLSIDIHEWMFKLMIMLAEHYWCVQYVCWLLSTEDNSCDINYNLHILQFIIEVGRQLSLHSSSLVCMILTLTVHSPTKSNKGKWRKCAKSDYVIEAGLIWERNRCPGSDTRVACHGWTVHCGAGVPGSKPRGNPHFLTPPFLKR